MDLPTNGTGVANGDWAQMTTRLCIAFVAGFIIGLIYRTTRPKSHVNPSFPPTLVMLAILIAMVTQVIGSNIARAFSLVGALSIVRFRTVVRDTQDTAFVIFSVVVGMAIGAGSYPIAMIGIVVGGIAAALVRTRLNVGWGETESTLTVRLGLGVDPNVLLAKTFDKNVETHEIVSVITAKQGSAVDYVYQVRMKPGFHPAAFVKELNQLEGVQSVELLRGEPEAA